jgi:molybdopterin synthase sulfur carrier subunit
MIVFKLPTQLRAFAEGRKTVEVDAATLGDAFNRLDETAPMIRSQVFDASGDVRPFVGVFVNADQIAGLSDGKRDLAPGSQVAIILAVAGG